MDLPDIFDDVLSPLEPGSPLDFTDLNDFLHGTVTSGTYTNKLEAILEQDESGAMMNTGLINDLNNDLNSSTAYLMVNPITLRPSNDSPYLHENGGDIMWSLSPVRTVQLSPVKTVQLSPVRTVIHYVQNDHNYATADDSHVVPQSPVDQENGDVEPNVEVWEIENFQEKEPTATPAPETVSRQLFTFARRESSRAAEKKIREQQQQLFSSVLQASLKKQKAQKVRQNRQKIGSYKTKNSVETTPYQSDTDNDCPLPSKTTQTKITKKKTTKGRLDHSQSERNRRNNMKTNLDELSAAIPMSFKKGEKASNQISKQKVLNGAKAYIEELMKAKQRYKDLESQNKFLRHRMQTNIKLAKKLKKPGNHCHL